MTTDTEPKPYFIYGEYTCYRVETARDLFRFFDIQGNELVEPGGVWAVERHAESRHPWRVVEVNALPRHAHHPVVAFEGSRIIVVLRSEWAESAGAAA